MTSVSGGFTVTASKVPTDVKRFLERAPDIKAEQIRQMENVQLHVRFTHAGSGSRWRMRNGRHEYTFWPAPWWRRLVWWLKGWPCVRPG